MHCSNYKLDLQACTVEKLTGVTNHDDTRQMGHALQQCIKVQLQTRRKVPSHDNSIE